MQPEIMEASNQTALSDSLKILPGWTVTDNYILMVNSFQDTIFSYYSELVSATMKQEWYRQNNWHGLFILWSLKQELCRKNAVDIISD